MGLRVPKRTSDMNSSAVSDSRGGLSSTDAFFTKEELQSKAIPVTGYEGL
jgi:hypothetical protein